MINNDTTRATTLDNITINSQLFVFEHSEWNKATNSSVSCNLCSALVTFHFEVRCHSDVLLDIHSGNVQSAGVGAGAMCHAWSKCWLLCGSNGYYKKTFIICARVCVGAAKYKRRSLKAGVSPSGLPMQRPSNTVKPNHINQIADGLMIQVVADRCNG